MAMSKQGYQDAFTGKGSEKVMLNANGTIAQEGQTVAGAKKFQVSGLNASNGFDVNHTIVTALMDLARGTTDSLSNQFTVTWEV